MEKIHNVDLVATEAHYHPLLTKDFTHAVDPHEESSMDWKTTEKVEAYKRASEY